MNVFKSAVGLARWLAPLSPSCREASRLQAKAISHPLPVSERVGLRIHLCLCRWCRRYGRNLAFLSGAARAQPDAEPADAPAPRLSEAARQRLRSALAQGSEPDRPV